MNVFNQEHCRSVPRARILFADAIRSYSGIFFACMLLHATPVQAADTLDLEGATITGSQELPKALHIVPWKSAEAGDLAGRPLNSLIDEILAPIDRDVFLRELEYYEAVHSSE